MEICFTYGVLVVTPDFVYNFAIDWHVERFRRRCEEAWNYLQYHVYGRMLPAQKELGEMGYWAGGNLPVGYIVDRREKVDGKKNPNFRKFIPYEPHAAVVRWLFERFRELAGQTSELFREIDRLPFLFPDFDESMDKELVKKFRMKKVHGGYKISSVFGLRYILSNPVYAGYWIYNNVVQCSDNHEPIVGFSTFLYAFNRLSAYNLDGTPNEEVQERRKKHVKRYVAGKSALLKNQITTDDPEYTIYTRDLPLKGKDANGQVVCLYAFYPKVSGLRDTKYMVPAAEIDDFFLQLFIRRLQEAGDFEGFLEHEEKELREQEQLQRDIDEQIRAVESLMQKIEKQLSSGELTNPRLLQKANDEYGRLEEEFERLQNRKRQITKDTTRAEQHRTYKQLMREAGEAWEEIILPEEIPLVIDTFVKKVVLASLSPRFYKIAVHWRDSEWGVDELVCFRAGNPSLHWKPEEDDLLRYHWPHTPREELLMLFPTRSYGAMRDRARRIGVTRTKHILEDFPYTVCWQDMQVMQQYGVSEGDLRNEKGAKLISSASSQ